MKKLIFFLLLSTSGFGQIMYIGPLNSPPIDPSQCQPSNQGQTGLCFASDGVHVSIAGQAFGPPMPGQAATVSIGSVTTLTPGSLATISNSGTGLNAIFNFGLPAGLNGQPGNGFAKGAVITYTKTETCGGSTGTIKSGYTNTCTGTLTINSIQ